MLDCQRLVRLVCILASHLKDVSLSPLTHGLSKNFACKAVEVIKASTNSLSS